MSVLQEMEWFQRLFPSVSFPADRVKRVITKTKADFDRLPTEDQEKFLQQERDLDFVSDTLTAIGLGRGELFTKPKAADLPSDFNCTNQ